MVLKLTSDSPTGYRLNILTETDTINCSINIMADPSCHVTNHKIINVIYNDISSKADECEGKMCCSQFHIHQQCEQKFTCSIGYLPPCSQGKGSNLNTASTLKNSIY